MLKFFIVAVAVTVVSFFLSQSVFGQTATPTSSAMNTPTPTGSSAVPTSAPATGFGPY